MLRDDKASVTPAAAFLDGNRIEMSAVSPSLYQINTRVLLTGLSRELGRPATLNDVPNALLDWLANTGFDWVWFLGDLADWARWKNDLAAESRVAPRISSVAT